MQFLSEIREQLQTYWQAEKEEQSRKELFACKMEAQETLK